MRRLAPALLALLALAGCELTEVTSSEGEDLVVVDAVLRAAPVTQTLLLHHTLAGTVVTGEPGARVVVTSPEGREFAYREAALASCADRLSPGATDSLTVRATCYVAGFAAAPGGTYELRVTTRDGRVLRGRTTVPGGFGFRTPPLGAGSATCRLPPRTNLPLTWTVSGGAWSYLSTMEINGMKAALQGTGIQSKDRLELTGLAISERDTTLVVPAEFGLFELTDLDQDLVRYLQGGFPPNVQVRLLVAAVDRNYVNAVRGGNFNPSGTARIPSVVGDGTGFFGSLVERQLVVDVSDRSPYPPCVPG